MDDQNRYSKKIKPNFHLSVSLAMIYYMGTWPPRGKNRPLYLLCTICSFMFMLGTFLISEIANLIIVWGELSKMVAGATLFMTNCTHSFKMIIILYRQKRIQDLLNITKSDVFSRDNLKYENISMQYTWKGIFHHIAFQSFGAIAVLCWGISPIVDLITENSRKLPVEGWYPYNVTATPAFEITLSYEAIAVIVACFHDIAMDTLVTGLITVACCQFALLKQNIQSIKNNGEQIKDHSVTRTVSNDYVRQHGQDELYKQLKESIKHSNEIYKFAAEIQNIFGTAIFLQLFVNCIIVCLIAFNIAQMKIYIPTILMGMLMYMCCMIYQIFIYCWHGNELHLHSTSTSLAAYSSDWCYATKHFKSALRIIITRAHNPFILMAGNIMSLSLNTFVSILRMSYSIFTVLQSTTGD